MVQASEFLVALRSLHSDTWYFGWPVYLGEMIMFDQFTLGIEEEFQIVDPKTRELRSHVSEFLEEGKMLLGEQIKPEMIQSMVEVGTGICKNIQEARADITRLRSIISGLAAKNGLVIVAGSTHPISRWQDQKIFEDERYELLVEELQA